MLIPSGINHTQMYLKAMYALNGLSINRNLKKKKKVVTCKGDDSMRDRKLEAEDRSGFKIPTSLT